MTVVVLPLVLACYAATGAQSCPAAASTARLSISTKGELANGECYSPSISADGVVVAFISTATNLVTADSNGHPDVFVHDRGDQSTERASLGAGGADANAAALGCHVSGDGRFVVYHSAASNLASGDSNGLSDVFLWNRITKTTQCISVLPSGVAASGDSAGGSLSFDGSFVAFSSAAPDLISGDNNGDWDLFLWSSQTGSIELVSVGLAGGSGNAQSHATGQNVVVSRDGRFVAFSSLASDLVNGDTNGKFDVFLRDRWAGITERVSLGASGVEANGNSFGGGMSDDGRIICFMGDATNLVSSATTPGVRGFVRDRVIGVTTALGINSIGVAAESFSPGLDSTGDFVVYWSADSSLVPGDTNNEPDVFMEDLRTRSVVRVNVGTFGQQSSAYTPLGASASRRGREVVFVSCAANLVAGGDGNGGAADVFVRSAAAMEPFVYCSSKQNSLGCQPFISASGWPCVGSSAPFQVSAASFLSNTVGLFFYSTSNRTSVPFLGGTLCFGPPRRRTRVQSSGGGAGLDCSGQYSIDFNAIIAAGLDASLVPGVTIRGQYFSRDPGFAPPLNIGLSNAIEFDIGP